MDRITEKISSFAANLAFDSISDRAAHAAVQRFIDTIGCALGGHASEAAAIALRLTENERPGVSAGRVLLHGRSMAPEMAAFANTAMIRKLDFNDRYPGGHPSDCLGALLALAGALPGDGKRFLTSMIVIYEIFARLSDAAKLSRRGWDQGYAVAVSTAAGVCNFLGLGHEMTAHAIGIAAASNLPLRVTRSGELTPWKNVATAYATRNGLFAALLAAQGMAGPLNAFEGRNGLWENVTGPFELAEFPADGGDWLTPEVQLKYWPVETNAQLVVWAAKDLRDRVRWQDLASIEVFTSKFTWFEIGSEPQKWDPQTAETADHSLPYILARTLVSGSIGASSFTEENVRDPHLRPLMAKIKVTVEDAIEALLPRVVLRVLAIGVDGRRFEVTVDNPKGHPDNPMDDEDIGAKFVRLGCPIFGDARSQATLKRLWGLVHEREFRPVFDLLNLDPA
jgi:2-methylcitrate dehydratase